MKDRMMRRASLIVLGALLVLVLPTSAAFAATSVDSVTPSAEPANVTTDLVITGSGFLLQPTVSFGPGIIVNSTTVTDLNHLAVNVTIAPNAPTGFHTVTVSDTLEAAHCDTCFTVTPPPTVTGATPPSIGLGAGTRSYTISGTGFLSGATVAISGLGVSAAHPAVTNDTTMTVDLTVSPTAITGARNITVTNPDNQFGTCAGCLTVTPPPRAFGFSPAQRAADLTNQVITITGSGFTTGTNGTTVAFSGTGITVHSPVTRVSATTLSVTIDTTGAPLGARDVTFVNPSDGGTSTCTGCFAITGPTTVAITTPSTTNGSVVATFSQPVSGVNSSNSYVQYTGTASNLATTIACADTNGFPTSCSSGSVKTAFLRPSTLIVPGQYYTVHIAATGAPAITDFGGLTVAEAMQAFRGGLTQQGESPPTTSTWQVVKNANAFGGSYVDDHTPGATASYRFGSSASSITWYTNIGPNYGIADLYVDGVLRATVNSYSPTTHYRAAFTVSGFSFARHTLTVRVRGAKGSSHATGTDVAVDAFKVGRTTVYSPTLVYTWGVVKTSAAFGGAYIRSDKGGSTTSFTFRGTGIEWDTVLGPSMGRAWVFVDGVLSSSIDNYSSTTQYGFARGVSGLSDGIHTIKIFVRGIHRVGATGSWIAVDRWVVT